MHVNECLNLRSSLLDRQAIKGTSPRGTLPYLYTNGTDYCRVIAVSLKKLVFGFRDYRYSSSLPLRLILFSVCTFTVCSPFPKIMPRSAINQRYPSDLTDRLCFVRRRIKNFTGVIFWPPAKKLLYNLRGFQVGSHGPEIDPLFRREPIRLSARLQDALCFPIVGALLQSVQIRAQV